MSVVESPIFAAGGASAEEVRLIAECRDLELRLREHRARVEARCAALGPAVVLVDEVRPPTALGLVSLLHWLWRHGR